MVSLFQPVAFSLRMAAAHAKHLERMRSARRLGQPAKACQHLPNPICQQTPRLALLPSRIPSPCGSTRRHSPIRVPVTHPTVELRSCLKVDNALKTLSEKSVHWDGDDMECSEVRFYTIARGAEFEQTDINSCAANREERGGRRFLTEAGGKCFLERWDTLWSGQIRETSFDSIRKAWPYALCHFCVAIASTTAFTVKHGRLSGRNITKWEVYANWKNACSSLRCQEHERR